jgi:uncharacterized protein (DUF1810 family)
MAFGRGGAHSITMAGDPHDLQRFVRAQQDTYDAACRELAAGDKRTHWMWFVFPQLKALGRSGTAQFYGISGREEAQAYWRHPVLGPRLKRCCELLLGVHGRSAHELLGSPDDLKLRSCMTLFEAVAPEEPAFAQVLQRYCGGVRDERTLQLLAGQ